MKQRTTGLHYLKLATWVLFIPQKQPARAGHVFEPKNTHVKLVTWHSATFIDTNTQKMNVCGM